MGRRPVSELSFDTSSDLGERARRDQLARLYGDHSAALRAYVRRAVGFGPPEPDDVVQATFARFAAMAGAATVANPRAFLFRMAHNLVVDARRGQSRERRRMADETIRVENSVEISPEDVLLPREDMARLEAALARLKPKQRVALLMHRMDDLSFAEIARRLGVSPSGARKLVEQALDLCAAAMKGSRR